MKGILLLNGEPFEGQIDDTGATVYCCDGAYSWARGKVRIDKNLGDFDSLDGEPYPPPEEVFPGEKDYTDGEIGICGLIDAGADEIEIYGGGGGREDHFLGNLHLLYLALSRGVRAVMITARSRIFAADGEINLGGFAGRTVSVLPFGGDAHIMNSRGLKYPEPRVLRYGECVGISNVVTAPDARITVAVGSKVLVIINGGEV